MKILIALIFACSVLFAGDEIRLETSVPIFMQAFPVESYHSIGFSNLMSADAADIASGNPAGLFSFLNPSLGLNFEHASRIKIFNDIYSERTSQVLPQSAGIVYPFLNFRFGLTYQKKYSSYVDFGEIPITTIEDMDGAEGETFRPQFETNINSFSTVFAFGQNNLFTQDDQLVFGIQLSFDYLSVGEEISNTKASLEANDLSGRLGISYSLNSFLGFGLMFEKGVDIRGEMNYKSEYTEIDTSSGLSLFVIQESSQVYYLHLPDKAVLGVQFRPNQMLSIAGTASYIFWEQVHSNYKNQLDLSLGSIFTFPDLFDISAGAYYSDFRLKEEYSNEGRQVVYFNLGIRKTIGPALLRFALYDSQLFSDKIRKHFLAKAGISLVLF